MAPRGTTRSRRRATRNEDGRRRGVVADPNAERSPVTALAWTLLRLAGVAAVGNWVAAATHRRSFEYVCKPATLALLIGVALALHPHHGAVRTWFVVGLLFSLAGDVFLMLPKEQFVAGLASFLLGHVAYVVGFALEQRSVALAVVGLFVVAMAITVIGRRIVTAVRTGSEPELLLPVCVYLLVISAMVVLAWGTAIAVAIIGAGLFYASDATLAWDKFVGELRRGHTYVMVTYHLGQAGLVLALLP